ncbi:MAG: response regulator transcription factor [Bacteroidia bacterium]|nr:response regulator transcription factor [Bacteroidia bacterium]
MSTIGIVDDEVLFRKGLFRLVESIEGVKVVLEAGNGQDLLKQLQDLRDSGQELPDSLLLDLQMPVMNGVETAKALQQDFPEINVIILSTHFSKAFVLNMIELGASSYLSKSMPPEEMEKTILEVAEKGCYYNDEVMKIMIDNLRNKDKVKASFEPQLTAREKEVLQLICEQHTAPEIAEKLFISRRTVESHRNNLLMKLNCKNIAGLVVYAIQHKLVKLNPTQFW